MLAIVNSSIEQEISYLQNDPSYALLTEIEAKRDVSFAKQTVKLFQNYLKTIVWLDDLSKSIIMDFLFSEAERNIINIEYRQELYYNEIESNQSNMKEKIDEKKRIEEEINRTKNALAWTQNTASDTTLDEINDKIFKIRQQEIFKSALKKKNGKLEVLSQGDPILNESENQIITSFLQLLREKKKVKGELEKKYKFNEFYKRLNQLYQERKKNRSEINIFQKQLEDIQQRQVDKFETYSNLCHKLTLAKSKSIEKSIISKNSKLVNKLLFLLKKYPQLISKKSPILSSLKGQIIVDNFCTIEILQEDNLHEIVGFGVATPCCLNIPASGTKYIYAALFDPRVSMVVIKDLQHHYIASSLITDNDGQITIWHVDKSKYFKPPDSQPTHFIIKKAFDLFAKELTKITKSPLFIAPGEATLVNFGYLDETTASNINKTLREDLMKNLKFKEQRFETLINSYVGSGRTDVGSFKYLAYGLENFDNLSEGMQDRLIQFILNLTKWEFEDKQSYPLKRNDIFQINNDEGHALCKLQFIYYNNEKTG